MNQPKSLVSPLWVWLGSLFIAWGWLLPNTNIPWVAFHRDAWVASGMALIVVVAAARVRDQTPWYWITWLTAGMACVPLLQYQFGLVPFAGIAWVSTAYVLGFLVAMLAGAIWARRSAMEAGDALFLATGIAATLSAGLALYQWLVLDWLGLWVLPPYIGLRAYANLGQPNQLATLLVWGLLASGWALARGYIRLPVATLWWAFLLIGITLTQSRTSWLVLAAFVFLLWYWRGRWNPGRIYWVIAGLLVYFLFLNAALAPASQAIGLESPPELLRKTLNESRPAIWAMFFDASFERPWFGYGWTQVSAAQMTISPEHPEMVGTTFSHAHNLFIDFILFMGWPLGLIASAGLLAWMAGQLRRVATCEDALLMLMLVAVGIHAMLELPLHYAYFLLPSGIAVGILNIRNAPPARIHTPRWVFAALGTGAIALLAAIIIDYLEVESNYTAMRFESARIGTLPPLPPPDVIVLTQMREVLRMARFKVDRGLTEEQLQWMRDVTDHHSSLTNLHSTAVALALNNHKEEAQKRVTYMCDTVSPFQCQIAKNAWKNSQKQYPELASITGPR